MYHISECLFYLYILHLQLLLFSVVLFIWISFKIDENRDRILVAEDNHHHNHHHHNNNNSNSSSSSRSSLMSSSSSSIHYVSMTTTQKLSLSSSSSRSTSSFSSFSLYVPSSAKKPSEDMQCSIPSSLGSQGLPISVD